MLGKELREAREAAEMTQEQLAFAAQMDRSYISQLERDKKSPTLNAVFRICDALEVRPSDVIARVEKSRATKRSK